MRGCLREVATAFECFKDAKTESGDSWKALLLIVLLVRYLTKEFIDDTILPLAGFSGGTRIRYNTLFWHAF